MKCRQILFFPALALIIGVALCWSPARLPAQQKALKAKKFDLARPATPKEMKSCRKEWAQKVRLVKNGMIVEEKPVEEFISQPGSIEIIGKRRKKERALRLADLVGEGEEFSAVMLIPCVGAPALVSVKELRANPDANLLTSNRRKELKLMRKVAGRPTLMPISKTIYAIKFLREMPNDMPAVAKPGAKRFRPPPRRKSPQGFRNLKKRLRKSGGPKHPRPGAPPQGAPPRTEPEAAAPLPGTTAPPPGAGAR